MSRPPRPTRRTTRIAGAALVLIAAAGLAGCAGTVPLTAAPQATDAACAGVVVLLPDEVAGQAQRETHAQGTAAWGEPTSVILHCGVEAPGPTTQTCQNVSGVDWIIDESEAPNYRFTSYGREPAVEVFLDSDVVAGSTVMADLSGAVATIEQTRTCTAPVVPDAGTDAGTDAGSEAG